MGEVPRKRTPIVMAELDAHLIARGYSPHQRALLGAHIAIENGGGASTFNWNLGNLSANPQTWPGDYWRPPWYPEPTPATSKVLRDLHQLMLDKKEPEAFRAYPTFSHGLDAYLRILESPAYDSMRLASTPAEFVQAWRDTGYTPRLNVAKTLQTFESEYYARLPTIPEQAPQTGIAAIAALVLLGGGAWWLSRHLRASASTAPSAS